MYLEQARQLARVLGRLQQDSALVLGGHVEDRLRHGADHIQHRFAIAGRHQVGDPVAENHRVDEGVLPPEGAAACMVQPDRLHQLVRQPPLLAELGARLGVVEPQRCGFAAREHHVIVVGPGQQLVVLLAQHGVHGEHADVLHQRRDKGFVGIARTRDHGNAPRRRRRVHAPPPVVRQVEAVFAGAGHFHEAEAEHERLDGAQSHVGQCARDARARLRKTVIAGIDRPEDLGRQRLVVLDKRGDLAQLDIRVAGQLQRLRRHGGERRQLRGRQNLFQFRSDHPWCCCGERANRRRDRLRGTPGVYRWTAGVTEGPRTRPWFPYVAKSG